MESGEEADVSYVLNCKIFWNWSWDLGAVQNSLMFVANTEQVMSFFVFLTVWNTLPLGHPTSPNVTATLKQSLSRYFVCANYFTFFSALKVTFFFLVCVLCTAPLSLWVLFSSLRACVLSVSFTAITSGVAQGLAQRKCSVNVCGMIAEPL